MNITDTHTHRTDAGPDAIINIEPDSTLPPAGRFSTGVHPWRSAEADTLWPAVERMAADPRIVAIGECGLDRLRGAPLDRQQELFRRHALLAEHTGKPLIIHCVRAWAELLAAHRGLRPQALWIVHGFRGRPELARQLLDAGIDISLGEHFRPETAAAIPLTRLHFETDNSTLPIATVARRILDSRAALSGHTGSPAES